MSERMRVLCVDDEPNVLEGLELHLRRKYDLVTATSGAEGLARLEEGPSFAVVVSDMRMPHMNGAAFLTQVRERAPDAVRMLLTGQTDIESAIAAINEGQIFRFLTKPCPPKTLLSGVEAAAAQHRLLIAERELMQETLFGSIKALIDVLALIHPLAFGRATRLRQLVSEVGSTLAIEPLWPLEIAAMVSQLGSITLSDETAQKLYYGHELTAKEQEAVDGLPQFVGQLLGDIPRLGPVLELVSAQSHASPDLDAPSRIASEVLQVAREFDILISRGMSPLDAVATLRNRKNRGDPSVLDALAQTQDEAESDREVQELPIAALRSGMVFAEDVRTESGTLLVARGHEVSASFVSRARSFRRGYVREPVRVVLPKRQAR
ncbi:MAG: response regulator [Myxococcota bacterium]